MILFLLEVHHGLFLTFVFLTSYFAPRFLMSKSIIPVIINYHRIFYIHSLSLLARSINSSIKATATINSAI
ncbi:hypothetical protein ACFXD6_002733 [Listeria monocytogenes]